MWLSVWDNRVRSKSVAVGSAVFNKQESQLHSHKLYFIIWGIFTQMTQASLIWVEIQIIEEGCNCSRCEAVLWERSEADCAGSHIIGPAAGGLFCDASKYLSIANLIVKHRLFRVPSAKCPSDRAGSVWSSSLLDTYSITRKMWLLPLSCDAAVEVMTWRKPQGISTHMRNASSATVWKHTVMSSLFPFVLSSLNLSFVCRGQTYSASV